MPIFATDDSAARKTAAPPSLRLFRDISPWASLAVLSVIGLAMLSWSWLTWPDVFIDFGSELYTAWQMTAGKNLYLDVLSECGPLSTYLNALFFQLFGVGLHTLVYCNLAILAGIVFLLHRILAGISDRFTATISCAVFLTLFAFNQYIECGNYNYVCPYRHEMTHGIFLSLLALFCLFSFLQKQKLCWLAGSGFFLGLVLLTKTEISMPAVAACGIGWVLSKWTEEPQGRPRLKNLLLFLAAAAVPPLVAFFLLSLKMPAPKALLGVLGSWPYALHPAFSGSPYFQFGLGFDHPLANLTKMLAWSAGYGVLFAPLAMLCLVRDRFHQRSVQAAVLFVGVVLGVWFWRREWIEWLEMARPLPLAMLALGAVSFAQFLRLRRRNQISPRFILRGMMIVFSFLLLGKMILNTRIYHYGFALAMPASLLLVTAITGWLPSRLDRRGGDGILFRALALALISAFIIAHFQFTQFWFGRKIFLVSRNSDSFYAEMSRGAPFDAAVEEIKKRLSPGETLASYPNALMLNYLTRRANPSLYTAIMPHELQYFGEEKILESLRRRPPDYIALVHEGTSLWGARFFGQDYAVQIDTWITGHYQRVALFGEMPFQSNQFGVLLLKLKKSPAQKMPDPARVAGKSDPQP